MDLKAYLDERRALVEAGLKRFLPAETTMPSELHQAMHYSLFAGGKRLRPTLTIAAAEAVGGRAADVLPVACAFECIHTYSLIHDDLPAMDDDDLRRGRPTCHTVFGQAMAILAGDALLTEAFALLTNPAFVAHLDPVLLRTVIYEIALAAGSQGMAGGQAVDILSEEKAIEAALLDYIHTHKTGALILCALRAGAHLGGATAAELDAITRYGTAVGLAFQIADDILDIEGEEAARGKRIGGDQSRGKATYPALVGLEEAKREAQRLAQEAFDALASFHHRADPLREIARFIVARKA
ncbi:MAG TPA: farnesyl diphosphate synthase [Candidatus Methylomirabilis sp.]|nr:farnesyl diphosphate synthase [Candidatus Methylomirabilis sp.]